MAVTMGQARMDVMPLATVQQHYVVQQPVATQHHHPASLQQQQHHHHHSHEQMLYTGSTSSVASSVAINTCASVTPAVNTDVGYSAKMDGPGSLNNVNNPVTSLSLNSPSAGSGGELGGGGTGVNSAAGGGAGSPISVSGRALSSPIIASQSLTITPLLTTISQQQSEQRQQQHQHESQQQQQQEAEDHNGSGEGSSGASALPSGADATALLNQMNQLGPSDRCTPSQAQAMGQQLLSIIAYHERNKITLPVELQNSFDIFHRCLAVVYGTFFLNLYTKANAPCLLCHGCKSLYPPGQFIHHVCPALPPNIVPCRSRMWRRCLIPLVSAGIDKVQQKQRWKYVLEKFSHSTSINSRRNPIPPEAEAQLLDMPECKRGRFMAKSHRVSRRSSVSSAPITRTLIVNVDELDPHMSNGESKQGLLDLEGCVNEYDDESPGDESPTINGSGTPTDSSAVPSTPHFSPLSLAEQLVTEVKRLQQELAITKSKLQSASEMISKMPSEACMREQLAQALASQQALIIERDQAKEQCKLAQDRASKLQRQLDLLRKVHNEMGHHFSS